MMSTAAEFTGRASLGWTVEGGCPSVILACLTQAFAIVLGGYFLALPVHASAAPVIDLHAIHAHVALAGLRIARDDARERDEAATVFRPALQDGEIEKRKIIALDDFFAGAGGDGLGKELADLRPASAAFLSCRGSLAAT